MHYPKALTDLHMAVRQNNLDRVKQLCTRDNVNDTAGSEYNTPLHSAALKGVNTEIIAYLLNMGCDINARDVGGDSALFVAAFAGKQKVVEFLLLKGAKIDLDRLENSTAFLEKKYPKILELLQNPDVFTKQSSYEWSITKKTSTNDISSVTQRKSHYHNDIEMLTLK
jgi:ankyrin repeat protein